MSKFVKTIRNNWKKSIFGSVAIVYGVKFAHDKYKIEQLMRLYSEEASRYGDVPVPPTLKPRNIAVILNPAANRRKAKNSFEKFSAPLLHLSGYSVSIHSTENEGHARNLAAELKDADMIVVAGGDGTLSETVTGLMRAHGRIEHPIGIVPLGRTNSAASAVLGLKREGVACPATIANATMAIVRGQTKPVDTLSIEVVEPDQQQDPQKRVYSMSGIRWGVYRDVLSKQDSYWYLGVLRGYAAVLFNSLRGKEPVNAHITYTQPCDGCSACFQTRLDLKAQKKTYHWYQYFWPSFSRKQPSAELPVIDYHKLVNPNCGKVSEMDISGADVNIFNPTVCQDGCGIQVRIGPASLGWWEFLTEGWRRVRGEPLTYVSDLRANQIEIAPITNTQETEEKWFGIDNEDFEVRPIRITLLQKSIVVFCHKQDQTTYTLLERALLGI